MDFPRVVAIPTILPIRVGRLTKRHARFRESQHKSAVIESVYNIRSGWVILVNWGMCPAKPPITLNQDSLLRHDRPK